MSFSLEELEGALKESPNREDWSAFLADKGRRTHLVTALVPLCQTEAARLERKLGRREGELVSTTYFAAVSLLEKYDPTRSDSLVKYVVSLIRNRVIEQLRLEEGRFTDKRVIDRAVSSLSNRFERPVLPTEPIVVDEINKNLRTKRVEEAGKPPREWTTAKLHSRVAHFESKPVLATDQFGLDGELSIDTAFSSRSARERSNEYSSTDRGIDVRTLLARLPEKERFVVEETVFRGKTLKEVGDSLTPPVSESRICQRWNNAVKLLRLSGEVGALIKAIHLTDECCILPAPVKTFLRRHQQGTLQQGFGRKYSSRSALLHYTRALRLLRLDAIAHYLPDALRSSYDLLRAVPHLSTHSRRDYPSTGKHIGQIRRARQYLHLIEPFSAINHARFYDYLALLDPRLGAVFRSAFLEGKPMDAIAREKGGISRSFASWLTYRACGRVSFIAKLDREDSAPIWKHYVPRLSAEQQAVLRSTHATASLERGPRLSTQERLVHAQAIRKLMMLLGNSAKRKASWQKYLSLIPAKSHGQIYQLPLSEVSLKRSHELIKGLKIEDTLSDQTRDAVSAVVMMRSLRWEKNSGLWKLAKGLPTDQYQVIELLHGRRLSLEEVRARVKLSSCEEVRRVNKQALTAIKELPKLGRRIQKPQTPIDYESRLFPAERDVYRAYHTEGKKIEVIAKERKGSPQSVQYLLSAAHRRIERYALMHSLLETHQWEGISALLPARIRTLLELIYHEGKTLAEAGKCMTPPATNVRLNVLHQEGIEMIDKILQGESIAVVLPPNEAIAQLSPVHQKILLLRVTERLTAPEISHALKGEISPQGAQVAFSRIEDLLKAQGHSISLTTRRKKA